MKATSIEPAARSKAHADLVYYHSGSEHCAPGHAFGPAVRSYYLIHYVRSGQGIFRRSRVEYRLRAGQGFLICPGDVTYYQADRDDPWSYSWVGFDGYKAASSLRQANMTADSPIFELAEPDGIWPIFELLEDAKKLSAGRELRLIGAVYMFLSYLAEYAAGERTSAQAGLQELYVRAAAEYIDKNFARRMSIEELAAYIGLNRSYLCAIFKAEMQQSPQQYLIRCRMERACELLAGSALAIGDISRSVGYDDPLVFSKMFAKLIGLPPREYRKRSGRREQQA